MTSDAKPPIATYVLIESIEGDRVVTDPAMIRVQATESGDRERDHLIYIYPGTEGSYRIEFSPWAQVELRGAVLKVSRGFGDDQ